MKIITKDDLEYMIKENEEKDFIIFGASNLGIQVKKFFDEKNKQVRFFCDNDIAKQGTNIKGVYVEKPEVLKNYKNAILIVAVSEFFTIDRQLEDLYTGKAYFCDFFNCIEASSKVCEYPSKVNSIEEIQEKISEIIKCGKPAMISRMGVIEFQIMYTYCFNDVLQQEIEKVKIMYSIDDNDKAMELINKRIKSIAKFNAGIFPVNEDYLRKFAKTYFEAVKSADVMGAFGENYEGEILKRLCKKDLDVVELYGLMPYKSEICWTKELKGKKVLVIHPLDELIKKQYLNREKLFKNADFLPEFELKTLKAINSAGYNECEFSTWHEALEYMYEEIDKIDFDIAIIGAGAYGLPLASYVKKIGKIGIHLGGASQLLFGIKGFRWDKEGIYNEYWKRPDDKDKPKGFKEIEGGCYW